MPGGILPSLMDYGKQRSIIRNIPVSENTIQRVFELEEVGSNNATRNSFVMIERKVGDASILWILQVVQFLLFKG